VALVWAIYHNFTSAQWRSDRKRHRRRSGQSSLEAAGAAPEEISCSDTDLHVSRCFVHPKADRPGVAAEKVAERERWGQGSTNRAPTRTGNSPTRGGADP